MVFSIAINNSFLGQIETNKIDDIELFVANLKIFFPQERVCLFARLTGGLKIINNILTQSLNNNRY